MVQTQARGSGNRSAVPTLITLAVAIPLMAMNSWILSAGLIVGCGLFVAYEFALVKMPVRHLEREAARGVAGLFRVLAISFMKTCNGIANVAVKSLTGKNPDTDADRDEDMEIGEALLFAHARGQIKPEQLRVMRRRRPGIRVCKANQTSGRSPRSSLLRI